MPAEDIIHNAVRNALIKDGWKIMDEPYVMKLENDYLYADMLARKVADDASIEMIVVEVKSFRQRSLIFALEEAFGQYVIYQHILKQLGLTHKVFLAVSLAAYNNLQRRPTFRMLMRLNQIALIVVDTDKEEVVEWIEQPIIMN